MENDLKLLDFGEKVVKEALKLGVKDVEVYLSQTSTVYVEVERGKIVKAVNSVDEGFCVRVSYNKSLGFSYTNVLKKEKIGEVIKKAFHVAKTVKPTDDWTGFSHPKQLLKVRGIYDKKVDETSTEEIVKNAFLMINAALETDKRVMVVKGYTGKVKIVRAIANSNGVSFLEEGTGISCSLTTIAKNNETTPICFEFDGSRSYNIDPEKVGKESAKMAVSALGSRKIETGNYSVVLMQPVLLELLTYTLVNSLKADNVQRGRSALKGRVGEQVASENLTFFDDGLLEDGLRTWSFDDEGTPSQKTVLIEKGVLRGFIYDKYHADKEGKESTGNAYRVPYPSYASTLKIEPTNLIIQPGKYSKDELLNEVKNGLLIQNLQGAHSSNPESGEFSTVATPAWYIRDGEIRYPVRGVMISGNIYDVLRKATCVGKDVRKIGFLVSPWIVVEDVKVIGWLS
ncbi:MAG: TldD/PmbA family protein [Candidatus Bathyarchaeota archaeon]